MPVVLAGITATLATLVNAGGLGDVIYLGWCSTGLVVTVVGALLAAVLALLVDHLAGLLEQALRPQGL